VNRMMKTRTAEKLPNDRFGVFEPRPSSIGVHTERPWICMLGRIPDISEWMHLSTDNVLASLGNILNKPARTSTFIHPAAVYIVSRTLEINAGAATIPRIVLPMLSGNGKLVSPLTWLHTNSAGVFQLIPLRHTTLAGSQHST
jgi:hypothetical protein